MFSALPATARGKLWPHQFKAVDFAVHHLKSFETPCLVRMPTGTGKTGVIACLTKISNSGSSLVITPWKNLRDQMVSDLTTRFWDRVQIKPNSNAVLALLPSTTKKLLDRTDPAVFVATFATLNDLRLNRPELYSSLAKAISLVVVDEGHYEPAVEWGKSIKGLNRKTVLLTATPYRNDLKLFRIADAIQSTLHFTHRDAIHEKIIRRLDLEDLNCTTAIASLSAAFVDRWKKVKAANGLPSRDPRAIVCCADAVDVAKAVRLFRAAGLDAIGVHETFERSKTKHLMREVPDPRHTNAEIWVHQFKLMEGLDDHRFCCVALFTRIGNGRKLIQQIGRVLRRDKTDRTKPAILLAPARFAVAREWNAYLEFETELKLLEPQHFRRVVETLLGAQPTVEYFDGRFRRRFDPSILASAPEVIIPPSVLVRKATTAFSLSKYIDDCTDTLNIKDAVILGPDINGPCQHSENFALWVYASIRNSRLLQDASLYEIRLETHCVVYANGYVLIADSRGYLPEEYLDDHTVGASVEHLIRFLDERFRPTHVSVNSSIPYDNVLRGAELRGHNLLSIPASLTDRMHICRSARGSSKEHGRRYVGLYNGRVRKEATQEDRRRSDLGSFVSWAEGVAAALISKVQGNPVFSRYMQTCAPPSNPKPRHICIDLLQQGASLTLSSGSECQLKSSSAEITEDTTKGGAPYKFSFEVEGEGVQSETISLALEYQANRKRFWFTKDRGASIEVSLENDEDSASKSFVDFLNQKQEVVLIGLDGGEIVYQGCHFFKVDYAYAESVLLELIQSGPAKVACATEKGSSDDLRAAKADKAEKFPAHSLFRAIADRKLGFPFDDDVLVCDDMGTECADFVSASFTKLQLAFIHAKAGSGTRVSASAFHDVVAQAMKNLAYLTRGSTAPAGAAGWTTKARWNGTGVRRLCRLPNGEATGRRLWHKLKSDIIDTSNPSLYVVLVTTGCCDIDELRAAASETSKRTPEIAQLLHLLDGLNGVTRQLGIRLLIYDVAYRN